MKEKEKRTKVLGPDYRRGKKKEGELGRSYQVHQKTFHSRLLGTSKVVKLCHCSDHTPRTAIATISNGALEVRLGTVRVVVFLVMWCWDCISRTCGTTCVQREHNCFGGCQPSRSTLRNHMLHFTTCFTDHHVVEVVGTLHCVPER